MLLSDLSTNEISELYSIIIHGCWILLTHLSNKVVAFFKVASHVREMSSSNEETSTSNLFRSRYSKAASLNASAFFSGQLKCFNTALSSAYTAQQRNKCITLISPSKY